ncbi:hypothetical protein IH601_09720 [Candidatus Bipolaricaulota bacterium]|nr:hypothetical protein [Candidatus Bipolaricaulota bacterium]
MNPLRMNRDELDSLPQDLLQRLRDAVIVGDVGRLEEIASEISQNHAEMGTALREIIHAYRHGELRELLQKGRTDHE